VEANPLELRQIQYFMEVAKREHVTEAAMALHVAQSAVSRQVFNLEKELGVNLFIREGRNVKLTMIGQMFLEHMEQAVKVIEEAQREIKEYLDPKKGTIRIGLSEQPGVIHTSNHHFCLSRTLPSGEISTQARFL
jgi:LysR family transcriptional regulator, transcription activator of glutamate synthase operon